MKLLIKYATRGRRELFKKAIDNIIRTTRGSYTVIISADEDDEAMRGVPGVKYGPHVSKVHAINRDLEGVKFDWLVNMSDDMRFTISGWDQRMLRQIQRVWGKSTDFFAHFNDGFTAHRLTTMSVIGWDYYQRDGYIYHPSYNSVSCDAEAMYVAMMRGRYHYFPEIYFNHLHPANLRQPSDKTYRDNDRFGPGDTQNYFKRMSRGFDVEAPVCIPEEVKVRMGQILIE